MSNPRERPVTVAYFRQTLSSMQAFHIDNHCYIHNNFRAKRRNDQRKSLPLSSGAEISSPRLSSAGRHDGSRR